jgi:hypothetical protein
LTAEHGQGIVRNAKSQEVLAYPQHADGEQQIEASSKKIRRLSEQELWEDPVQSF